MKKFIFYLFLTFFISNYSFSEVSVEDNVSLFGIKLGDTLENYNTNYRHFTDPTCEGVVVYFEPDDCYKPEIEGSMIFFSHVDPPIKNDDFKDYSINALFISKKITNIRAVSKETWKKKDSLLCKRKAQKIMDALTDKYISNGWDVFHTNAKRNSSEFHISSFCPETEYDQSVYSIVLEIYFLNKSDVLDKEREMYIKSIEGKIDTKGF